MSDFKLNVDFIYPIGSIYITTKNINPGVLFGGTWVQTCKSRYMMGAGSNVANTDDTWGSFNANVYNFVSGSRIGEPSHTLINNELPKLTGSFSTTVPSSHAKYVTGIFSAGSSTWSGKTLVANEATGANMWGYSMSFGNNGAHNNMPPGQVYYIWERTA